jgi:hypothetical protein
LPLPPSSFGLVPWLGNDPARLERRSLKIILPELSSNSQAESNDGTPSH